MTEAETQMHETGAGPAETDAAESARRKPRIALMGEFSAGKSTLANLLMEQKSSPVKVTATRLPPIWYARGDGAPLRIGLDGEETALEGDLLDSVSPTDTQAVRIFMQTAVLEMCDIIDMPGSSDPNIAAEVWQTLLPLADAVIWCTPATQAWRQSEAAIWEDVSETLHKRSLLLLTRFDKVRSSVDGQRVVSRVQREVEGMFRQIFPVSLTDAMAAGEDEAQWRESGMDAFYNALIELLSELDQGALDLGAPATRLGPRAAPEPAPAARTPAPRGEIQPDVPAGDAMARLRLLKGGEDDGATPATSEPGGTDAPEPTPAEPAVMPRRVTPRSVSPRRPRRTGRAGSLI